MRSDIVAGMNLDIFPIIGLIAFGSVFIAATIRALLVDRGRSAQWSRLPLESGGDEASSGEEVA